MQVVSIRVKNKIFTNISLKIMIVISIKYIQWVITIKTIILEIMTSSKIHNS